MASVFLTPPCIISGENALELASSRLALLGKKALVVTDSTLVRLGVTSYFTRILEEAGVAYSIYGKVDTEPTDLVVMEAADQYRRENCDFFAAVGGGSPIDTMKAAGILTACGGKLSGYMGKSITTALPPMAAVPTTAGTGSEATQFTIITDTETQVKMLLKGPSLIPGLAIVDPVFTLTAPKKITAATGVDALTHAIEAFTSKQAQPMSDTFALSAAKRIFEFLPVVYREPDNRNARAQMAIAATEAGIAFNNSSVTLVHGMSRPIGALFHVPHGLSNAVLLEVCLRFALPGAVERFAELARRCCGISEADDMAAAGALVKSVSDLLRTLEIPTLQEFGIPSAELEARIPKMARDAYASGSPGNTRRETGIPEMEALYRQLL